MSEKAKKKVTKTRSAYTVDEDENILRHILTHDRCSQVKGNDMWMKMAKKNLVLGRTWQSLKNRYLKTIQPNLHKYGFLSSEDKDRLTSGSSSAKQLESVDQSSDKDSRKSGASKKYSLRTDEDILKFLISRKKFDQLSGNEIWKEMAHLKIARHSWQSMRNRFLTHIAKNLHLYNISDYAKKRFKSGISYQLAVDSFSDDTDIHDIQDSSDNEESRISDSSQERMKQILKKNSSHSDNVDIESNPVNCNALKVKEPARLEMPQQYGNIAIQSDDDTSEEDCDMARPTLTRRLKGQKQKFLENLSVSEPEPTTSTVDSKMTKPTEYDEHIDTSSVEFSSSTEEEMLVPTIHQNDELPQCAAIDMNKPVSDVNETLERSMFACPEIQNESSNSSTASVVITTYKNHISSGSSECPSDEAIQSAAVVQVNCQIDTEDKDSMGSCESIDDMQLEIYTASDIETNSECSEAVDHCDVNLVAQVALDADNSAVQCESLHETKSDEAENDAIRARLSKLSEVLQTMHDIENGLEVDDQKFNEMFQCTADIIGVSSETLMQMF